MNRFAGSKESERIDDAGRRPTRQPNELGDTDGITHDLRLPAHFREAEADEQARDKSNHDL